MSRFLGFSIPLLVGACLLLHGCAYLRGSPSNGEEEAAEKTPDAQWLTTEEALGIETPKDATDPSSRPVYLSHNVNELQQQIRTYCAAEQKDSDRTKSLERLVGEVYASGIAPAVSTEALIKANCGPLAKVVWELVAQGGRPAVAAVVERALFLAGPGAEGLIESAATSGLQTNLGGRGSGSSGSSVRYAMAYFPAGVAGGLVETAAEGSSLYSSATPGYGIYTFILSGKGVEDLQGADAERYQELLRVIETYVFSAGAGAQARGRGTHTFLVPVTPGSKEQDLLKKMGPELSARMRSSFADYLRFSGRGKLAGRLAAGKGPILISALEPRLIPAGRGERASRLLVDLSDLAPEYMYAVVDAYDRSIPEQMRGNAGALDPIRARLSGLFAVNAETEGLGPSPVGTDQRLFVINSPLRTPGSPPDAAEDKEQAPAKQQPQTEAKSASSAETD